MKAHIIDETGDQSGDTTIVTNHTVWRSRSSDSMFAIEHWKHGLEGFNGLVVVMTVPTDKHVNLAECFVWARPSVDYKTFMDFLVRHTRTDTAEVFDSTGFIALRSDSEYASRNGMPEEVCNHSHYFRTADDYYTGTMMSIQGADLSDLSVIDINDCLLRFPNQQSLYLFRAISDTFNASHKDAHKRQR